MMGFLRDTVSRRLAPAHLEVPYSRQCQAKASQCQCSRWLAANAAAGIAGKGGSPSRSDREASGGSTDAGVFSGTSVQAPFSTAGTLSEVL